MSEEEVAGWFVGRIPDGWFVAPAGLQIDRDEILVIGELAAPQAIDELSDEARQEALRSRVEAFREETRAARIKIARSAESKFERKVSWGASCGGQTFVFTHLAAPAMTRLRMRERRVLDTLIDAGVARSRSDALAWCVRMVGEHEDEWLAELRDALAQVHEVRDRGPRSG
ncbi:MAG: hypothetical protein OEO77_06385 [Acidimicrobiia bacterium]|nr:hypothetical protein [Acidimicrobiia bacterium]